MIYTISETIATIADCAVLFCFLIFSLSFKDLKLILRAAVTISFAVTFTIIIWVMNQLFTLEGAFIFSYFIMLFLYCRLALKGKWWHQFLMVLVGLAAIFLVNAVVSIVSASILHKEYANLLLMRNPARILLLFISKIALVSILISISAAVRRRKFILHPIQTLVSVVLLITTIIAGSAIEKLLLENLLPMPYAAIIMISLVVICILLFCFIIQLSVQNQAMIKQVFLETQLKDNEIKMKESLQWNNSIRTLQHDLNNHMAAITQYLESNEVDKAISYIEKINGKTSQYPKYTDTNNQVLNAVVDLKRMICTDQGIDLKCYIQDNLLPVEDVIFTTVFGNLFDNAIEAERNEETKEIRLMIEILGSYLHITIQNRISQSVIIDGHLPQTKKINKSNHGLGMLSVNETIDDCGGTIEYYEQNNWFVVDVLIPCL